MRISDGARGPKFMVLKDVVRVVRSIGVVVIT
jgi:hypothetical protein